MGDIFWYFKNEKAGFESLHGVLGDVAGERKGREQLCEQSIYHFLTTAHSHAIDDAINYYRFKNL